MVKFNCNKSYLQVLLRIKPRLSNALNNPLNFVIMAIMGTKFVLDFCAVTRLQSKNRGRGEDSQYETSYYAI